MLRATPALITFRFATLAIAIILAPNLSKRRLYIPAPTNIYYNYKEKGYYTKKCP